MRIANLKFSALMACAMVIGACVQKEDVPQDYSKDTVFTAIQENGLPSKASIDGTVSTIINWDTADKVNYFGGGTGEFITLVSGAGTPTGQFSGTVTKGSDDYVLYPFQAGAECVAGVLTAEIPSRQVVPAGSFDPEALIMVGKVASDNSITFYNAVGMLAITIPAGEDHISKMVITGNADERLSGKITISGVGVSSAPSAINGTQRTWDADRTSVISDGVKYVEVIPADGTKFVAGSTYYVAVAPDASLDSGIYVLLYDGSASDPANLKLAVKKSTTNIQMGRNKVKKTTLPAIAGGEWYSMMTLTGCYMAPFNLGAVNPSSKGGYYSFGEVDQHMLPTPNYSTAYWGSANLSGLTDAATCNWGPDWRIPTSTEFGNNISIAGSLPASGYYRNGSWNSTFKQYYWTATPNGDSYGLCVFPSSGNYGTFGTLRYEGCQIRAVLN